MKLTENGDWAYTCELHVLRFFSFFFFSFKRHFCVQWLVRVWKAIQSKWLRKISSLEKCTHQNQNERTKRMKWVHCPFVIPLRQANWNDFCFLLETLELTKYIFVAEKASLHGGARNTARNKPKTIYRHHVKRTDWWMKNRNAFNDQLLAIIHVNTCTQLQSSCCYCHTHSWTLLLKFTLSSPCRSAIKSDNELQKKSKTKRRRMKESGREIAKSISIFQCCEIDRWPLF